MSPQKIALTVKDAAVKLLRSLAKHTTEAAETFMASPETFTASTLTVAQRCGAFNLAMSAYGVGLVMPTDSGGNKVWNDDVFTQGMALAKDRTLTPQVWVHQKFAPIVVPGKDKRRSFYETLTQLAIRGQLAGVDPKQFEATDPKETQAKVREWLIATVKGLCGTKEKPGVLAQSRNFRLAVREDLGPQVARSRGAATVSDADILAELQ